MTPNKYRIGDIVELTEAYFIQALCYRKFLGLDEYPKGTKFKIIKLKTEKGTSPGLRLLHNGKEITQTGRYDGITANIPWRVLSLCDKKLKLLNKIKDFR